MMQKQNLLYILLINLALAIPVSHAQNGTDLVREPSVLSLLAGGHSQIHSSTGLSDWEIVVLRNREGGQTLITKVFRGDLNTLSEGQRSWFLLLDERHTDTEPFFSTLPSGKVPFDIRVSGYGYSVLLFDTLEGDASQMHIGQGGFTTVGSPLEMVTQPEDMPEGAGGG